MRFRLHGDVAADDEDVAPTGAPSPLDYDEGEGKKRRRSRAAKNRGDDACPKTGGLFDNRIGDFRIK